MSENRERHNEELQALVARMREQGLNAEVADVPVPVCSCPVQAGIPTPFGDMVAEDYVMVPRSLLGDHPLFVFPVRGESMRDAGFHDGDNLLVELDVMVNDGDTVVCSIDDEYTVKTFFTDDDGVHWLVPANDAFDPICLSEQFRVVVVGRVRHVLSRLGRSSYRELAQRVKQKAKGSAAAAPLSVDAIERALRLIAPEVCFQRHWIGVYRTLSKRAHDYAPDYETFCQRVAALLPHHKSLPTVRELQRMDVQSFTRPVTLWEESNAPVTGKRFEAYKRVGMMFIDLLDRPNK